MALSKKQKERYARHIILNGIGESGQERILNSKVLIIGAGGLGSSVALYLSAAGIGTIGIVDNDQVELSNLQRQIIHTTNDLGRLKVESAKETMTAINPDINVKIYKTYINENNIMDMIKEYDFIVDATDNFTTKFLINDACVLLEKPFSHAGILRFSGQIMTYIPGKGPCYRCVFSAPPPKEELPEDKEIGIIGAMCGVIGSLQATETIKYLTGIGDLLTGKILTYDALTMKFHTMNVPKKNEKCKVCGTHPSIFKIGL